MAPSINILPDIVPNKLKGDNKHEVKSFDLSTANVHDVVDAIKESGGVFIRNFVDVSVVKSIEKDIRPYLDADTKWEGEFFPSGTRRVLGLAGKSPLYTEKIVMHPLWMQVCDELLSVTTTSWNGQTKSINTSKPQHSATAVFSIGPGTEAQELHRDDITHHNTLPGITYEQYKNGRDTGLGLFVAMKKATTRNGATRFVPGSHLTASSDPPPNEKENPDCCTYAEMDPGDAFMMLSSCYHGGSYNSTPDEERLIMAAFTIKGMLRQEENQYLVIPKEQVLSYPLETQKRLGYGVSQPFCGWVDLSEPYEILRTGKAQNRDLFAENTKA